jgi:hypothetical protein
VTFFVSDSLKDRVTEKVILDDVYQEDEETDLFAAFYSSEGLITSNIIESISKYNNKLDIKINLGKDLKSIEFFLKSCTAKKLDVFSQEDINPIITLKNPNIELVKIKKANKRNSYFARIVIV